MIPVQSTSQSSANNPLKGFFRKAKFQVTLPSEGKWNNTKDITFNDNKTVDIFAMTASDDIKFKSGDSNLSGNNTFSLIKNCIPNILKPENLSSIDIDVIMLSIRWASYGPSFSFNVTVPKTK